jgi:hypothetical protein
LETIISSLDARKHLRATMTACSWRAGWCSLLIRAHEDPAEAEEFVAPATRDHLIVLITGGSCGVEVRDRNGWQHHTIGHHRSSCSRFQPNVAPEGGRGV